MAAGCACGEKSSRIERDGDAGPEEKALHYIGPDDGAQTANERVENGDDTESDDEKCDGPTGKSCDGEREQIKDKTHLGEVARGKGEGRIHAHAGAKALAEVFIDRHGNCVAEEGHDDGADGEDDEDEEEYRAQANSNRPHRPRRGRR